MSDNKWIEQDWEMMAQKDEMFRIEREMRLREEWERWEEEHKRPAKITITINKSKKNEHKTLPF